MTWSARSRFVIAVLLAAVPWLNPFGAGPSPAVQPWLTSMACVLLLWVLAVAGGARPQSRLVWPFTALTAWAALSHGAVSPEVVMLAGGLTLIAVAAGLGDDQALGRALQAGLLLAAAASAASGLAQYFGLSDVATPWINGAAAGEAYANLRQPNQYATLCWMGAAVLLWGTLRLPRTLATGLMVLLAVACAASVSRTGMLQGAVLTVLAALWPGPARRARLALCAFAALAYFAASLALPYLLEATTGALPARTLWGRLTSGPACSGRSVLWSNVLTLIWKKPLLGWGWGELDYAHYMTLYPGPRFCDILDNAHNLPLHLAVELGVPAALLVCGAGLFWIWRQRPWSEQAPQRQLAWALLALILLHSLLEYPLWYGPFQLVFGISLGWLLAPTAAHARHRGFSLATTTVVALALATGYAAWDYARVSQIYLQPSQRLAPWRADTLEHARGSWLFAGPARFAELTLEDASRDNAGWMYPLALQVLHYSPEPRVVRRVIESATLLGREDEAVLHLARYRAAFPQDYQAWRQGGSPAR